MAPPSPSYPKRASQTGSWERQNAQNAAAWLRIKLVARRANRRIAEGQDSAGIWGQPKAILHSIPSHSRLVILPQLLILLDRLPDHERPHPLGRGNLPFRWLGRHRCSVIVLLIHCSNSHQPEKQYASKTGLATRRKCPPQHYTSPRDLP